MDQCTKQVDEALLINVYSLFFAQIISMKKTAYNLVWNEHKRGKLQ